jgi:predicted 3-demethylubiquinone-9 3-methyltransferase (glyoxalase superfamily)
MQRIQKITPCLWFDYQAEAAAGFYCSIFDHSKITAITHYGKAGFELHGRPEGSVMTVSFELDGQTFTGLNGGPVFTFSEAVSFQVNCQTQEAATKRPSSAVGSRINLVCPGRLCLSL